MTRAASTMPATRQSSGSAGILRAALAASGESLFTGVLGASCLLVSGALVARLLGVESRGHLATLCVVPVMLSGIGCVGIPSAVTFHVGRSPGAAASVVQSAYTITLIQALLLMPVVAGILLWSESIRGPELGVLILLSVVALPALLSHQVALSTLQGLKRFRVLNGVRLVPAAAYAFAGVVLYAVGESRLVVVFAAWAGAQMVAAIASALVVLRAVQGRGERSAPRSRDLLRVGARGQLASGSAIETYALDQMALAIFAPAYELGLYAAANAFGNLSRMVSRSTSIITYPVVVGASRSSDRRLLLRVAIGGMAAINFGILLILVPLLPIATDLLFGPAFAASASVAFPLVLAAALSSTRQMVFDGLRSLERPQWASLAEIATYPTAGMLSWLWIPAHGAMGLAFALVAAFAISLAAAGVLLVEAARRDPSRDRSESAVHPAGAAEVRDSR